ncbi:MAG: DUF3570 domain-containing protein [Pseudomonadales bacterium]|jgi:hypothetical protein|nr:DUF3570 domain-containing protein [Pseudomonadales bacterium]
MKKSPLAVLTSAALALPAFAATQPSETSISVKASHYKEEDIAASDVLLGSNERYDIDVYQFQLTTPVGADWSLDVNVNREIMSGASPWGTISDFATGEPTLIMSGATISDQRTEVSATVSRYFTDSSASVTLSHSDEDDYEAKAIAIGGEWNFMDDMATLAVGASYSSDDITPTDALMFGRVTDEEKRSRSFSVSWTHILDRTSLVQLGASITDRDGYLSDPYKIRDTRPDNRLEKTFSAKYRKYFGGPGAAMHLDYRYFRDDFGIRSHTLDFAWHQQFGDRFRVIPGIRYYSQEEADFYLPADSFLIPLDQYQSSDFRLSSYGAWAFSIKGVVNLDDWTLDLSYERYISAGDYGLDEPEFEHPALLEFDFVTLGVSYRF